MADDTVRSLDATDTTQVLVALQTWINGLKDPVTQAEILPSRVYLEYMDGDLGYSIKSEGGAILDEDIVGNFTAELPFMIYFTTNAVPDNAGEIFKPLNDLAAWFKTNGTIGLDIGDRRVPDEIVTLAGPKDLSGKDTKGNTTFFSVYSLTYDEEAI